jgi:hypothetical protein
VTLIVSDGKFNPNSDPAIAAWPAQVAKLKSQGSVRNVFISIGGASPPVEDFTTIQKMLADPALTERLKKNISGAEDRRHD